MTLHDHFHAMERGEIMDPPVRGGSTEPVDPGDLGRLLLRLEADAHRGGWDNDPAQLLILYRLDCQDTDLAVRDFLPRVGPMTRCPPLGAGNLVPATVLGSGNPTHMMRRFAFDVACGVAQPGQEGRREALAFQRAMLRSAGVIGFALLAESWGNSGLSGPQPDRKLADIPGSIELRTVFSMDLSRTQHQVYRKRGSKPQLTHLDDSYQSHGRIPDILNLLVDVTLGEAPTSQEEFNARYCQPPPTDTQEG